MSFDHTAHLDISLPAAGDLSTKQYRFVSLDSSGNIAVATRGALAIGVLQDNPGAAGRPGRVRTVSGTMTKVVLGGSVTAGQAGVSDANGAAVNAASTDNAYMGFFQGSGSSGDIVAFLLQPRGLS
ncbi:capsid cement protein [Bradyrhizobium sp. CCBAU 51753]|uniref:capsid cement protein n=1 Tax=Bradyrhizobium sp. CCBAU 51753 TaxID=1325100 RepID=UPI00188D1672|nr:capsid cement protein [Bradyrhizobium sp. CCBAU 51753]QOZ25293.1 hypothetical protein XH93_18120 [Bradyrhizobium sp. CCBAU 51753]